MTKINKIRTCPNCGDTETIEVTKLMTIDNKKQNCILIECDSCGYVFSKRIIN